MSTSLSQDIKSLFVKKIIEERKNSAIFIQHYWKSNYIYFI